MTAADTVTPDASFTSPLLAIDKHFRGLLNGEHARFATSKIPTGLKRGKKRFRDQLTEREGEKKKNDYDQPNRKPCRGRAYRVVKAGLTGYRCGPSAKKTGPTATRKQLPNEQR